MVAIRDHQFLLAHRFDHALDGGRISNAPDGVGRAVFILDPFPGLSACLPVQRGFDSAVGVAVEHEDLAEVCARGLEQLEPIRFGAGERLLVTMNNPRGVVLEAAQGDEASPQLPTLLVPRARDGSVARRPPSKNVFLIIRIKRRFRFRDQDAFAGPIEKVTRGAHINIVLRAVFGKPASADDAHQVVGAQAVVASLHIGRDFVVRLRYDASECGDGLRMVMKRPKRQDFGHGNS